MKKFLIFGAFSLSIHYFYKYQEIKKRYKYEDIDIECREDLINLIKMSKDEY